MIIVLGGKGASGKTTVAKLLAEKLHFRHYSIGDLMRELATTKEVSLLQLNKLAETEPSIDKWLDAKQEALGKQEDYFVLDSRLGFLFVPQAVKILLDVDDKTAAERVFKAPPREGEEPYHTKKEALQALLARRKSEMKRIKKAYEVNPYAKKHYDLVLDTTRKTPEQICIAIFAFLKKKKLYK